jgi:hypothetical protein
MHDKSPCVLERRCSSAGVVCPADDRSCQNDATAHGLEIVCETTEPKSYLYCPPGAEQRDSPVVWILLLVALVVAVVGGALAIIVLRRRLAE